MPASDPFLAANFVDDPLPAAAVAWAESAARRNSPDSALNSHAPEPIGSIPTTCAQFVLDRDDIIRSHQIAAAHDWYFHDLDLTGKSLRAMLCELRPDWEAHLPFRLGESNTPIHLPEAIPGVPGLSLVLHRLRHGDLTFVTATPDLPPPETLNQAGIADFQPDPRTFAKLYLRLRRVENRLDHYLAHFPGVVYHQRADLTFTYVGPGCETLLGLSAQTLSRESQALFRLIHPRDERIYYQELDRNAEAARPFSLVYRVIHPETRNCTYLLDIRSPIRSRSGLLLGYEGVWLDITRQKIAEHGLITRAWKEALSSVTGGLLTDFNNVITGIYSLSELYHNTLAENHPLRDGLGLIRDNAGQAQNLVRKIIELNRETSGDHTYASLAKVVREQLDVLKIILPRGTHVSVPDGGGEWPVYIDEASFRHTLVNLALNSRDAMRGSGEVRIHLRRLAPGEQPLVDTVPPLPAVTEPMFELTFADNGSGISPGHLPRIFDPFFSTKSSSNGAGLGLYNARLFAETHGGSIAARSSPGRGTEIVLLLPAADLSLTDSGLPVLRSSNASGKRIRVIYLDEECTDDAPLAETLRLSGWEVYSVSTDDHARRRLRQEGVRLDLLIIRPRSAESSLRILFAEVRRDHPGLPIVLYLPGQKTSEVSGALRSQVDLVLPADIRDRDAVDSLAKLLRLQ